MGLYNRVEGFTYSFQSAKRCTGYTVGAILIGTLSMTTNGCLMGLGKVTKVWDRDSG